MNKRWWPAISCFRMSLANVLIWASSLWCGVCTNDLGSKTSAEECWRGFSKKESCGITEKERFFGLWTWTKWSGGVARFSLESEDSFALWAFPDKVVPDVLLEWLARVRAGLVSPTELLRTGACILGHDLQCRGLEGEMCYVKHLESKGLYYTSVGSRKRWHCFIVDVDCFALTYSMQHRGNRDAIAKSAARELQMTPEVSYAEAMKKRVRTLIGLQSLPWPSYGAQFLNQQAKDFLSQQKVVRLTKGSVLLGLGKVPFRAIRLLAGSVAVSMSRGVPGLPPRLTTIGVIEEGGWIGALGCRDLTKLPFNFVTTQRRDCYGMIIDAKEFRKQLMPLLPESFWIQEQELVAGWQRALGEQQGRATKGFALADLNPEKSKRHYGVEVPRECLMQCAPDLLQLHRPKPPPEAPRWRLGAIRHHGTSVEVAAARVAAAASASTVLSSAAAASSSAASASVEVFGGEGGSGRRSSFTGGEQEVGKRKSSLLQLIDNETGNVKVLGKARNFVKQPKIYRPVYLPTSCDIEYDDHVVPLTDWLYAGTFEGRQREMELRKRAERHDLRAGTGTGGGGRTRWRRQQQQHQQRRKLRQQRLQTGEGQDVVLSTEDGGNEEGLSSVAGDEAMEFEDDDEDDDFEDEMSMPMSGVTSLQSGPSVTEGRRPKVNLRDGTVSSPEDAEFSRRQGEEGDEEGDFFGSHLSERAHFEALADHFSNTLNVGDLQHRRVSECGISLNRGRRQSEMAHAEEEPDEVPERVSGGRKTGESRASQSSSCATDAATTARVSEPGVPAPVSAAAFAQLARRGGRIAQPLPMWPPGQEAAGEQPTAWTPPSNFRPSTPKPVATAAFISKLRRPLSGGTSTVPRQNQASARPSSSPAGDILNIKGSSLLDD